MNEVGKGLVLVGIAVMLLGLLIWSGVGRGWLGRLPGDIRLTRGDFSLYLPIATCVIGSIILTLVLWLFRK